MRMSLRDRAALNRYEASLLGGGADPLFLAILAGAARTVRLACPYQDSRRQVIWDTGADVIGPLFVSFVAWVMRRARQKQIPRLYFMARDGQVLQEIAGLLAPVLEAPAERRYLHVSRQSLLLPSYQGMDAFDRRWIMWHPLAAYSVSKLLGRCGLLPESVEGILSRYGFRDFHHRLSLAEKQRFAAFLRDPGVIRAVQDKAEALLPALVRYLRQEGMADGVPFAVVDLGWAALSQFALSRILDIDGIRPSRGLAGFYLGLNWLFRPYGNDLAEAFLFSPANMFWRIARVEYSLLEIFAAADQGRTLGYQADVAGVTPCLAPREEEARTWGSDVQRESILAYAREVVGVMPPELWAASFSPASPGRPFQIFCNTPSRHEAEVYGAFPHDADMGGGGTRPIAPVMSPARMLGLLTDHYWVQGVLARTCTFFRLPGLALFLIVNILRQGVLAVLDHRCYRVGHRKTG